MIWKLDRISRRQHEGIGLLADWYERGIRVVVVTQQIDLSGADGRMVAGVLFGLAEIELEYRRERQAAVASPDTTRRSLDRLEVPVIARLAGPNPATSRWTYAHIPAPGL